jgi:hypothetical protein
MKVTGEELMFNRREKGRSNHLDGDAGFPRRRDEGARAITEKAVIIR